jgi:UDP-4-amino-4-deoxy-L-arabinose formyltransferase/UDP-glucuronic acid dehydrogenase (UDP-4-keto-hexauronic acid decarboxylating)
VLDTLARSAHELVALLTTEGGPAWALARKLGLPASPARQVRDPAFARELGQARVELLLNVHSLYIVPAAVLAVPSLGAYNLHPGPLPACAGLNAPSWAIYYGHETHGVTLHRMEAGIDTGPVLFEDRFTIQPTDTALSVALRCAQRGVELVKELLAAGDPSALPHRPQDPAQRRYFGRGVPQGGRIDWHAPARRIHDFVRACDYTPFASPWGTPRATLEGREVEILKTAMTHEPCDAAPGTVEGSRVATADEWLELKRFTSAVVPAKAGTPSRKETGSPPSRG